MWTRRRSNAIDQAPTNFELKNMPYNGTKYRRDERNAEEIKRIRLKSTQFRAASREIESNVPNQNMLCSTLVMGSHSAKQRYINIGNKGNVRRGLVLV